MPRESTGRLFDEPEDEQGPARETHDGSAAAPLAERMRPRTLEEFVGQAGLVGSESLLAQALRPEGKLPSLILWGPPGTGKTTLARLIARASEARLIALSAVLSWVKEVRAAIDEAVKVRRRGGRVILFIDEIHRFNKAQQDALLHAASRERSRSSAPRPRTPRSRSTRPCSPAAAWPSSNLLHGTRSR